VPRFISLIGAGWLGLPLAKELVDHGHHVFATTTREERLSLLTAAGVDGKTWRLQASSSRGNPLALPLETEILLISLPPGMGGHTPREFYGDMVAQVIREAGNLPRLEQVLFTGSTGVYGSMPGEWREDWDLSAMAAGEGILCHAEEQILTCQFAKGLVFRFGGLVGPGREPVRSLAGREHIPGGNIPVNLIHQDDAIGILRHFMLANLPGGIYNACADGHPLRAAFYPARAIQLGLIPPTFTREPIETGYACNQKLKDISGYAFRYPDPAGFPLG